MNEPARLAHETIVAAEAAAQELSTVGDIIAFWHEIARYARHRGPAAALAYVRPENMLRLHTQTSEKDGAEA